jgi:hypothetical protein
MPFSTTPVRANVRNLVVDLDSARRNALTSTNACLQHVGNTVERALVISGSNQRATKVELTRPGRGSFLPLQSGRRIGIDPSRESGWRMSPPRPARTSSSETDIHELVSKRGSGCPATIETLRVLTCSIDGEVEQFIAFVTEATRPGRLTWRVTVQNYSGRRLKVLPGVRLFESGLVGVGNAGEER